MPKWHKDPAVKILVLLAWTLPIPGCGSMIDHSENVEARESVEGHGPRDLFSVGFKDFRVFGGARADVEEVVTGEGVWKKSVDKSADPSMIGPPDFLVRFYAFLDLPLSVACDTVALPFLLIWRLFGS